MPANATSTSNAAIAAATTPMQPRLVHSIPSAAERLDVSASTIWAAIAEGRVKTIQIGRRRLITDEELHRVAREGTGGPLRTTARPRPAAVAKGA